LPEAPKLEKIEPWQGPHRAIPRKFRRARSAWCWSTRWS